jgi:hypothetical protein
MINHVRTLLMNIDYASGMRPTYAGDEYIDPSFNPVQLPGYLQDVRDRLFGVAPDRLLLNYKVWQLLSLLDASDLSSYVTYFDNRITYDLRDLPFTDPAVFDPVFEPARISDQWLLQGTVGKPDVLGISHYQFELSLIGDNLTIQRLGTYPTVTTQLLSYTAGVSGFCSLPGTGMAVAAKQGEAGETFRLHIFSEPQRSLPEQLALLQQLPYETHIKLFGVENVEPYATFRAYWEDHDESVQQLSGLLLAFIFRINEERLKA